MLPEGFYRRKDVTRIAKELLGKALFTRIGGKVTGGLIVETEAYSWKERGCHAYNNRRTKRNEVMFGDGGHAYVYLCYGIHNLFNVVTNQPGTADAVLIRALEPLDGITEMLRRTNQQNSGRITSGPGKLTRALGIERTLNGKPLSSESLWIADVGRKVSKSQIVAGKRIGIDYAGEDAKLQWRFTVKNNEWISV